MYKLRTSGQVDAFLRALPPDTKHRIRIAISRLARWEGDIRGLEDELAGFYRLRVGRYRVVFCYAESGAIDCVYAGERKLVYELFSDLIRERLSD